MSALLQVNDLKKHFLVRRGLLGIDPTFVYAVDGVSLHVDRGETLALVGNPAAGVHGGPRTPSSVRYPRRPGHP